MERHYRTQNGMLTGNVIQVYGKSAHEPQLVSARRKICINVDFPLRPEGYLVQAAAVTCADIEVSRLQVSLAPIMYRSDRNASLQVKSAVNQTAQLLTQPWFVGTMIGIIVSNYTITEFFCCCKRFVSLLLLFLPSVFIPLMNAAFFLTGFSLCGFVMDACMRSFICFLLWVH